MVSKGIRVMMAFCILGVIALGVSACGGGSSSTAASTAETTSTEASGGGEGETSSSADVAAAEKILKPFIGSPSPFPTEEPLKEALPPDTKFVYMQCGSPVCQLQWPVFEAAAKTLGVQVGRIKAGNSAQEVSNAFDTAVAENPDAVFVPAIEPSLYGKQLQELDANGVVTAASGVVDPEEAGFTVWTLARPVVELYGQLLAAKTVEEKGDEANVVFYATPELAFIGVLQEAFEKQMEELCPECTVRSSDLPLTTIGSTAPQRVVSDLQANPETNVAIFGTQEAATGVPAALQSAGISEVLTYGFGPTPANLEYIKNGEETGGLGLDLGVNVWTVVDEMARAVVGQELSPNEKNEASPPVPDTQFLEQKDVTFDPTNGWTGYPEFEKMYEELWKGK